jgi:hypothetical protein
MRDYIRSVKFKVLLILGVFVVSVAYCFFNFQFWTHVQVDDFSSLKEVNSLYIKGLYGKQILIHHEFEESLSKIEQLAEKYNLVLVVNSSYRFPGTSIGDAVVVPVTKSNHNVGYALDINIKYNHRKYINKHLSREYYKELPSNIKDFLNDIRNDSNLRWGGDFKTEDPVHIDVPLNIINNRLWDAYSKNCSIEYANAPPKWMFWL